MTQKTIFKTLSVVLLLTLCVSFYSCEKEGVFNPKQKISKIYADFERTITVWDPETGEYTYKHLSFPKQMVQQWRWDDNQLSKIDFWSFYFWWEDEILEPRLWGTDHYYYENNRLVRINSEDGYTAKITYDGDKYKKMEFFNDYDDIWLIMNYVYEHNKISQVKIEVNWNEWKKETETKILSTFLPKEMVYRMVQKSEKKKSTKSINTDIYTINYTYTGNNIKEMILENIDNYGDMYRITANYLLYDTKQNPFYKKVESGLEGEFMFGSTVVSSKNNPLEVRFTEYEEYHGASYTERTTYKYTYVYNKNYPIEIQVQTIWEDEEDEDIEVNKIYYEYQ